MAKKIKVKFKGQKEKKLKKQNLTRQLLKIASSVTLLILLVAGAGVLGYIFILKPLKSGPEPKPATIERPADKTKTHSKPDYEIFQNPIEEPLALTKLKPIPIDLLPIIAIIIDDIGYDRHLDYQFINLDKNLTFSLLPFGPVSREFSKLARAKGCETMLHLPMEPVEYPKINPGPGTLLSSMQPDSLIAQLQANLDQFQGLKGVNNHMGSHLSTLPEQMRQIFSVLKKQNLFYIDSRTTAQTVAKASAGLFDVPFAERDIFIDHFQDPSFIKSQLKKLVKCAQLQGYAIGIAHPHPVTYKQIKSYLPRLKEKADLVPASQVIRAIMDADAN
ncbi:MAG: divergent polysaccharide deacetylase family protein [Desulfobacteraceae bacterium]|nr:divergent polysaccharide deacetylase family protein [Desulfobacteraceae bacterium]